MALCSVSFMGASIGLSTTMNILVPNKGSGPFPVFYLLHGLSDDHTAWLRLTSIERYVEGLPLIVVMPTTHRGWYINAANPPGLAYEDHIIKDVVGWVDRMLPTVASREGRAIGGLSMGGYGAVKLGLKHYDMFCSVNSHSGAVLGVFKHVLRGGKAHPDQLEFNAIFGSGRGGPNCPIALAKKCPKNKRPAIRLDCGADDFLLQHNRDFHERLSDLGYKHEYVEFPGAHSWAYWDTHIQEALRFHCGHLGIQR